MLLLVLNIHCTRLRKKEKKKCILLVKHKSLRFYFIQPHTAYFLHIYKSPLPFVTKPSNSLEYYKNHIFPCQLFSLMTIPKNVLYCFLITTLFFLPLILSTLAASARALHPASAPFHSVRISSRTFPKDNHKIKIPPPNMKGTHFQVNSKVGTALGLNNMLPKATIPPSGPSKRINIAKH